MKPEEVYVQQVLRHILSGPVRDSIEAELRGHIADRIERGGSAADAIRSLGEPRALAESYLAAVPMRKPPHLRRGLAKLVDFTLMALVPGTMVLVLWLSADRGRAWKTGFEWPVLYIACVIVFGLACWYPILAEHAVGQTLGKRLFGLQVVTEKGGRIGIGQAIVRALPFFLQIFTIDALFALFTDRRQRAFEMLSKTRVVDVREATQPVETMATAVV